MSRSGDDELGERGEAGESPTHEPRFHFNTKDLPQAILDEIRERVWLFSAIAFSVRDTTPEHQGVVTLVSANGRPCLLTAAHVWSELARGDQFALSLEGDRPLIAIRKEFVRATVLSGEFRTGVGPDLALVEIPPLIGADIRRSKIFYNLDRRRPKASESSPEYEDVVWGVIGAPAEQSRYGPGEVTLRITLFVSGVNRAWKDGGFDYVEIGYDHEHRNDLPTSYGGVSGSGLWHVTVAWSVSAKSFMIREPFELEGVAFYQQGETATSGAIRCHGRQSVYGPLLGAAAPSPSPSDA